MACRLLTGPALIATQRALHAYLNYIFFRTSNNILGKVACNVNLCAPAKIVVSNTELVIEF